MRMARCCACGGGEALTIDVRLAAAAGGPSLMADITH